MAGQHQAARAAPLLTALVEYWLTTAQVLVALAAVLRVLFRR
ncbi:MAG TPA: hypothetical protein VFO16_22900 [Pseudonocardiaceae bacterium]|nr:hypothetical protein [Pseudonocardiaceae bacterium]